MSAIIETNSKTSFYAKFDSPSEMLNWLSSAPNHYVMQDKSPISQSKDRDFTGTKDYAEATALLTNGWADGRANMQRGMTDAAALVSPAAINSLRYDVAGHYPQAALAAAGAPEAMVTVGDDALATRPIARFVISASISGSVSGRIITQRGAAILSWIDALEEAGTRCEIDVHFASSDKDNATGKYFIRTMFRLKNADDILDIDRAAYVLTHPSMLRRHIFRLVEAVNFAPSKFGVGYGYPTDASADEIAGGIYFGRMFGSDKQWRTVESAVAYVKEMIRLGGYLPAAEANAA